MKSIEDIGMDTFVSLFILIGHDLMWKAFRMNWRRITWVVLMLYLLVSIYSVAAIGLNLPQFFPLTPVSTLLAFGFAALHAGQRLGWRRAAVLVVIVFLTGLIFESIGVATGQVYGPYHYTDRLGPKFLGLVPYLIPLAWTMMIYPAMVIAESILPHHRKGWPLWLAVAALGGIIMTAWDLAMDPLMVKAGNWIWEVQGPYFGVPLQNFAGWWLTTFAALAIYQAAARRVSGHPHSIPNEWAVWAYLITAASTVLIDLFIGLGGPALAGFFAMLPWVILGLINT